MSEKSGIGSNVISLPQGGGAVSGIGQTFSPDLFTGTGNFSVPIGVPPGRNGFQPQLTIGFSTGSGNGPFGLGWGLSVPGVMRKTSKGLPTYDDTKDVFVLSGAEDLIPVAESDLRDSSNKITGSKTTYRPRTEGLFARIEHHKLKTGHDFWKVWSKDGLISYYGYEDQDGIGNATVCDPDDASKYTHGSSPAQLTHSAMRSPTPTPVNRPPPNSTTTTSFTCKKYSMPTLPTMGRPSTCAAWFSNTKAAKTAFPSTVQALKCAPPKGAIK